MYVAYVADYHDPNTTSAILQALAPEPDHEGSRETILIHCNSDSCPAFKSKQEWRYRPKGNINQDHSYDSNYVKYLHQHPEGRHVGWGLNL